MLMANADGPVDDAAAFADDCAAAAGRCLNGSKCRCHQHRHRRVFQVGEEEGLDDDSAADDDVDVVVVAAAAAASAVSFAYQLRP